MNLPNAITVARVLLVPVFVALAYLEGEGAALAAFIVFVVASASDSLDGHLARRWNVITRFGQFLDPLADKLLVGGALVALIATRGFPLWAALVIAVREVAVQVLRTRIVSTGADLPASPAAKAKTALQVGMVGWWLIWPTDAAALSPAHWAWLTAVIATTLWSGYDYFSVYLKRRVA